MLTFYYSTMKQLPNDFLVLERLIHTAEALGLTGNPARKAMAEKYRKMLQRRLERERKNSQTSQSDLQPA
jgi:hypothetical protein